MPLELFPKPKSKFLRVKCPKCESINIVFSHATTRVQCKSCKTYLTESKGGRAKILGEILGVLE